jgi:hypothetical protein
MTATGTGFAARRGALSCRTTIATHASASAAPTAIVHLIDSRRTIAPSAIATTGFAYAYVATLPIGALSSSHNESRASGDGRRGTSRSHTSPPLGAAARGPTRSTPAPRRLAVNANMSAPAAAKGTPTAKSGGIVSPASSIPR